MITREPTPSGEPAPGRQESVVRLLEDLRCGRRDALDELFPLVYDELRELAHRQRVTRLRAGIAQTYDAAHAGASFQSPARPPGTLLG